MKQELKLLDHDIYAKSTKDYTGGLCPLCHDEFNLVEEVGDSQLDANNKVLFITMACDCGASFVQKLKNQKNKKGDLSFKVFGYSHLCDCDNIDLSFDNCTCSDKYKISYGIEYARYLIQYNYNWNI